MCPNINEENDWLYAGGIAGYFFRAEISDCYNTLKIDNSANADSVFKDRIFIGGIGGITGELRSRSIERCYNAGAVSGSAICASDWADTENSNYYLAGSAADGDEYANALTPTQMSIKNVYTGFDFENTWEIDPNSSYKYPQLKENRQQRVEGISIESLPAKLNYAQWEDIDTDGGTVKITYEGSYETIVLLTKDMISGYDMTAVGEQNVTVAYGGKTAEFQIDVGRIDVTSVVVSGNSEMQKGTSSKLSASVVPQNATDNSIKWSSSDESKATVDADGNVTLNEDEDYIVSYSDNVNVGTAEMTIFGIGYYEGSLKKAFKIILNKNDNYVTDDSANDNANNNKNDNINNKNDNINNNKSDNTNNKSDNTNNKGTDKKITVGKVTIKKIRNVKGRKIEIQYNKINKADGYQIRYSLKSNMMGSSKTKTTTKTKYTLTSLKKKKKYYIQVRAFGYDSSDKKVYGKWSAKKSVKINK